MKKSRRQRTDDEPATLLARMMRKELYVIETSTLVEAAELAPHLVDHLRYMIDLEQRGLLFASGPFTDGGGNVTGDGLTIVRAKSYDQAESIALEDPFTKLGLRKAVVRRWIVNEGRIQLSVDLSNCGGDVL